MFIFQTITYQSDIWNCKQSLKRVKIWFVTCRFLRGWLCVCLFEAVWLIPVISKTGHRNNRKVSFIAWSLPTWLGMNVSPQPPPHPFQAWFLYTKRHFGGAICSPPYLYCYANYVLWPIRKMLSSLATNVHLSNYKRKVKKQPTYWQFLKQLNCLLFEQIWKSRRYVHSESYDSTRWGYSVNRAYTLE